VLTALEGVSEPVSLTTLSSLTSLHLNTLRDHLEVLESDGRVRRHRADPQGRGRPAWLYESTGSAPSSTRTSEYAGLAAALAASIQRHSPQPRAEAAEAGRYWGRELADTVPGPNGGGAAAARHKVVDLLAGLGFSPEASPRATTVRLTRCPLLDAARAHRDVVCAVHLGIVQGALQEWGAPAQEARLLPFSEPGACRLLLPTRQRPTGAR
jgi:predicted ArsR family transcriptional regulator